ncbi:unnamed protein product [Moneuplotes crassus]|uniref:Uncharacterized protein n=2 Tax=Euplotes crassus TaxID=5936 RepID=A0AAD2DAP5_EUPCR|nr:unnamed protein product [Moneuplotes crassus]
MLTEAQFQEAITFIKDYKDALYCIEQINERRATVDHYQNFSTTVLAAMKNKEIALDNKGFKKGEKIADFKLAKAFKYSTEVLNKYKLSNAVSRDDLLKKLAHATSDLV